MDILLIEEILVQHAVTSLSLYSGSKSSKSGRRLLGWPLPPLLVSPPPLFPEVELDDAGGC